MSDRRIARLWRWLKYRLGLDGAEERREKERRETLIPGAYDDGSEYPHRQRLPTNEALMGLYNFQKRFVPFIKSGEKKHTIRGVRKNPDKPGNTLYLYTGLRTKKAKLIKRVECVNVEEIRIEQKFEEVGKVTGGTLGRGKMFMQAYLVSVDGEWLSPDEREQLARRDGFSDFHEMMKFWTTPKNRLPFKGHIIHWK